ncbi:MAG TPA: hypothetical protein VGL89_04510 [Candidatus Koribacter sp.]|jgi:hypothetical protein
MAKSKRIQPAPAKQAPLDYSGLVALVGALLAFAAFLYFYRNGETLLYGDAVAHINIARRVFDCREPGIKQLGTVWLPFPHLLMIPFLISDNFWISGIGGALPSMVAFVLGGVGIYRLLAARCSHAAGWMGAAIYLLNPNLLYMQATAMGESIYLALMIWAVVYLDALARGLRDPQQYPAGKALTRCAIALACAILTRYDGWFFAFACGVVALVLLVRAWTGQSADTKRVLRRAAIDFVLLCALTPALWLSYNYLLSRRPLDFMTGPYSAKAIAERTTPKGAAPYPGKDHPVTASLYLLKAAKLNMADGRWQGVVFAAAVLGSLAAITAVSDGWVWLLLWMPLPFYALSIAYGSVPIFVPQWWPFSYYNVRYGLELLPAFAVGLAVLASIGKQLAVPQQWRVAIPVVVLALVAGGYVWCWRQTPICLQEARANGRARMSLDRAVARYIKMMPESAGILMQTGSYVGALQMAGRDLDHVIWEGVFWQWEDALNSPAHDADYVIAFDDDTVSQAVKMHPYGLQSMIVIHVAGQPGATIYRSTVRNALAF